VEFGQRAKWPGPAGSGAHITTYYQRVRGAAPDDGRAVRPLADITLLRAAGTCTAGLPLVSHVRLQPAVGGVRTCATPIRRRQRYPQLAGHGAVRFPIPKTG
jgi:hypothetical protein